MTFPGSWLRKTTCEKFQILCRVNWFSNIYLQQPQYKLYRTLIFIKMSSKISTLSEKKKFDQIKLLVSRKRSHLNLVFNTNYPNRYQFPLLVVQNLCPLFLAQTNSSTSMQQRKPTWQIKQTKFSFYWNLYSNVHTVLVMTWWVFKLH